MTGGAARAQGAGVSCQAQAGVRRAGRSARARAGGRQRTSGDGAWAAPTCEPRDPAHIVHAWLGNSKQVAEDHYPMLTTEDDFARAVKTPAQIPARSPPDTGRHEPTLERRRPQSPRDTRITAFGIPPRGTERPPDSGRETQNPPAPGTESGTPAGDRLIDLLAIVATLPPRSIAVLADLARLLATRQEKDSPGTRTP